MTLHEQETEIADTLLHFLNMSYIRMTILCQRSNMWEC